MNLRANSIGKRSVAAMLGATALAAGLLGTASAASAAAADTTGLEEIVVTARKVSENLQTVPVAITAFSGSDLLTRNVQRTQDIGSFTPGMSMRQGQSTPAALTITLRGQVQTDILATLDPSVGVYVDGAYWARAYGLNGDFLDVRSVEVLKGPQGTLFGRNTTGGALVINTNDPDFNGVNGMVSGTYGRYNELNLTGVLNAPLVDDKVALRLAATHSRRDGYTNNVTTGGKLDNRDRTTLRGKLLLKPTESFSLLFSGEYFNMDEAGPAKELRLATNGFNAVSGPFANGATAATAYPFTDASTGYVYTGPNTTYNVAGTSAAVYGAAFGLPAQIAAMAADPKITMNNETPYARAKTLTFGGTAAFDQDWGAIKGIGNYRRVQTIAGFDLDGSSAPIHFTEGKQDLKQYSFELQATGKAFDNKLDFAAGAFIFHEEGFDQSISVTLPGLNPLTSHFFAQINNDSSGIYGQATWHITDKFNFTGGLRYSVDDKGIDSRNNNYNRISGLASCSLVPGVTVASPDVNLPACSITRRDAFRGVSYTAGLDYQVNDNIMVYAKTSKGFRSGGQNLRAPTPLFFIPFQPEVAYSQEIGFKSEFFDRRARLNVAAYTSDINNIQRSTLIAAPGGLTATVLGNAGKLRVKGLEAELQVLVFTGFQLSGTLGLTDPKYIKYSDASGDRSFEAINAVSKSSFTLAADYAVDLGSAKLKLHGDYSWLSSQASGEYNYAPNAQNAAIIDVLTIPAAGIVGARAAVSFADDRYEIAVYGRNLTNNRDFTQDLIVAPLGYVSGTRREPLTYGLTGTVKF